MKFRQHIRVYGYPDALKAHFVMDRPATLEISGIGKINMGSRERAAKMKKILESAGVKYKEAGKGEMIRIKYLGTGDVSKKVRGRLYKGDILYTVEANDERELLDKRDAVIQELRTLKVPYEDVCKWVCETAPKVPAKKMFTPKQPKENLNKTLEEIAQEQKKLKNTVEDLKDKLSEAERKKMKIFAHEDMKARAGVLH